MRIPRAAFALSLLALAAPAQATVIVEDTGANDFRIASITGLDIGGTIYDATFHHGGITYNAFAGLVGTPLTFTTSTDADAAVTAMINAISAASIDASTETLRTQIFLVPFAVTVSTVSVRFAQISALDPLAYTGPIASTVGLTQVLTSESDWVSFAVPEPSLLLLCAASLAASACRRRRRPSRRHLIPVAALALGLRGRSRATGDG